MFETNNIQSGTSDIMLPNAINTYFSSRTEALTGILFQHLPNAESRLANPFARTHIIVPNSGMQRYLELSIAEHFGICSHIEMSFASRFLKARYQQILPDQKINKYLDTRQITFAILSLWAKNNLSAVFDNTPLPTLLKQYNTTKQRYHLAENIAQLFSQYLNERPELISAWQRGGRLHNTENTHELWQMHLFNDLKLGDFSGNEIQQQFHSALALNQYEVPDVHLFGFHATPPVQLADFMALSSHAHVYAYIFNPSVAYWRDIVPTAIKMEKDLTAESEAALMTVGNQLLATWGQSGKYLIEQLNESINTPFHVDESLKEANLFPIHSVLTWVQSMVRDWGDEDDSIDLNDHLSTYQNIALQEITTGDFSISLHAGASPRREVEILYDHLCNLFANNDLNPSDILVMMPNLRDYAPHIQSIFGADTMHNIPFSLANQSAAEADPDTQAFLAVLNLINTDFSAQALFDVISEAHIRETFNLSLTDIETIRYWLTESRYAKHYQDTSEGRAGSLEKLLDALLLACIGGEDCEVIHNGKQRVALPAYRSSQRDSLLSFCRIIGELSQFTSIKNKQTSLTEWRDILISIADEFLSDSNRITPRLLQWHDSIISADDNAQKSMIEEYVTENNKFDYDTVTADIIALLENEELHGPFLSGGISFCAMVPMRSIPAKMICLLGLNQSFPRVVTKDPLDLRNAQPLWSDRDINKEYKYFFLETLMAVRERLYLSHVGKDDKTGEDIPPSIMIDELFAFIERYCPNYSEAAQHDYPIQGFLNTNTTTYQALYKVPSSSDIQKTYPHVDTKDIITDDVDNNDNATPTLQTQIQSKYLADALCEPLQLYLRQYLATTDVSVPDVGLAEHDMVALDSGLDNWRYKDALLQSSLFQTDARAQLIQQNRYPPVPIGEPLIKKAEKDIAPFVKTLQPWVDMGFQSYSRFVASHFNDVEFHLLWESKYVGDKGQWLYSAGANNVKKTLRLWVSHVLQSLVPDLPNYHSHLFTLEKGVVSQMTFTPFDNVGVAQTALSDVLALYHHIFNTPYAATLEYAPKKSETVFIYKSKDYPLFPRLSLQAQVNENSHLSDYFAPIESLLNEHVSTTEVQS